MKMRPPKMIELWKFLRPAVECRRCGGPCDGPCYDYCGCAHCWRGWTGQSWWARIGLRWEHIAEEWNTRARHGTLLLPSQCYFCVKGLAHPGVRERFRDWLSSLWTEVFR
jgi:hypothetical protein